MTPLNRTLSWVAAAGLGCLVALGVHLLQQSTEESNRARGHGLSRANSALSWIQTAMESYAVQEQELPIPAKPPCELDTFALCDYLGKVEPGSFDEKALNTIREDPWMRPYHIQVLPNRSLAGTADRYYDVLIWSDGPNQRNEKTGGDDLSRQFTIVLRRDAIKVNQGK
jgi:hypothetical protein